MVLRYVQVQQIVMRLVLQMIVYILEKMVGEIVMLMEHAQIMFVFKMEIMLHNL